MLTKNAGMRSHATLWQMAGIGIAMIAVIFWQRHFLYDFYFHSDKAIIGWYINGAILLLFLSGVIRLVYLFVHYGQEEWAINRFVRNVDAVVEPLSGLPRESMVSQRYRAMLELHNLKAPINHSALAASLIADESSRLSFPKFTNNVLILTGVFGTIVSLSIALLGASDMISAANSSNGLGAVIAGMSTALSTTMTAIIAFLFFAYFFLKLTDLQTHVISRIEYLTTTLLMPRFDVKEETVLADFSYLIKSANKLLAQNSETQQTLTEATEHLHHVLAKIESTVNQNDESLQEMISLLRAGFRLPDNRE